MSEWVEALPDEDSGSRPERRSEYRLNRALRARLPEQTLYIVNLSASGFRASLTDPLPVSDFPLTIELPGRSLEVQARLVWSLAPDYAGLTDAGFSFVELASQARETLLEFLRSEVASSRAHDAPDPDAL